MYLQVRDHNLSYMQEVGPATATDITSTATTTNETFMQSPKRRLLVQACIADIICSDAHPRIKLDLADSDWQFSSTRYFNSNSIGKVI